MYLVRLALESRIPKEIDRDLWLPTQDRPNSSRYSIGGDLLPVPHWDLHRRKASFANKAAPDHTRQKSPE
jgi:hypothetical protein